MAEKSQINFFTFGKPAAYRECDLSGNSPLIIYNDRICGPVPISPGAGLSVKQNPDAGKRRLQLCLQPQLSVSGAPELQAFPEADDPVGFFKSQGQMEPQADFIVKFTITGKFSAALFLCPFLTFRQQFRGKTVLPVFFGDKNPFQISDGRAFGSLNVIMPELALCKCCQRITNIFDEAGGPIVFRQFTELIRQFPESMIFPHLYGQCGQGFGVFNVCFPDYRSIPS